MRSSTRSLLADLLDETKAQVVPEECTVPSATAETQELALRRIRRWMEDAGHGQLPWPTEAILAWIGDQTVDAKSVQLRLFYIDQEHRAAGHRAPSDDELIGRALKGYRRANPGSPALERGRRAATGAELAALRTADGVRGKNGRLLLVRNRAAVVLARGDVGISDAVGLLPRHVHVEDGGLTLVVGGVPTVLRATGDELCPVRSIRTLLALRPPVTYLLGFDGTGKALTPGPSRGCIIKAVNGAARRAGLRDFSVGELPTLCSEDLAHLWAHVNPHHVTNLQNRATAAVGLRSSARAIDLRRMRLSEREDTGVSVFVPYVKGRNDPCQFTITHTTCGESGASPQPCDACALEDWIVEARIEPGGVLFPARSGSKPTTRPVAAGITMRQRAARHSADAGTDRLTPHQIRKGVITESIDAGSDPGSLDLPLAPSREVACRHYYIPEREVLRLRFDEPTENGRVPSTHAPLVQGD